MKVVAFNGSARKDGNTAILLRYVLTELEQEGIETEMVQLAGKNIHGDSGKSFVDYSVQDLLQAGDTEFLNWMVVIGAVGDAKATYTAYMPDFVATGWGFVSWRF